MNPATNFNFKDYQNRRWGANMEYHTETITPQLAAELLAMGAKNRRVSETHVKKLAEEMKAGRWVLNGETIKFSADGKLIDGQHRLEAIILSGVSIVTSIAVGIQDERAFETIDNLIRKRTADQLIEMDHTDVDSGTSKRVAAVARRLRLWEITEEKQGYNLIGMEFRNMTDFDVVEYFRINKEEILWMHETIKNSFPYKRCGAGSSLTAALVILNRQSHEITMKFIDALDNGVGLTADSPVHLLRDRLIYVTDRKSVKKWGTEVMAITIKAWNYFSINKPMKNLNWRQGGDRPERFPVPRSDI